ncbi:hypothetical protein FF1_009914 [Malus domestica]
MAKPIWKQADPRFVWYRNLLDKLIEYKTAQLKLKGLSATLTIVSRRYTRHLGTRMWRRGANLDGDVANFIETEQLVEIEGFQSSLLQDISYYVSQRYGETMAVDLTDKHGNEGQLSMAFSAEMQNLPNVRYVSFDFHHVCGNSNFENLKVLYEQISEQFEKQGYFLVGAKGNILEEQKGIVRSNCIDCLDRTNVTQSYLAQKCLDAQLQRTGVLDSSESISMFAEDYQTFRALWVEQGDEISLEYAGTYALKGDLVRYGKQTFGGIIKDVSALSRYFLNNFQDGIRQDAMDLISCRYTVRRDISPSRPEYFSYLPVASALLIGGLTTSTRNMAKHHPDLIMCRKQPGIAIGRLCEKCDGKCVICDSYVRPCTLVRVCDECNYGSFQGRCVICGGVGISDAYYCKECTQQEKDRDGCPKIVNLGSAKTDLFYERKKYGFKKR